MLGCRSEGVESFRHEEALASLLLSYGWHGEHDNIDSHIGVYIHEYSETIVGNEENLVVEFATGLWHVPFSLEAAAKTIPERLAVLARFRWGGLVEVKNPFEGGRCAVAPIVVQNKCHLES